MNYGRKILNLFPWQADFTKKPIYFVCKVYCKVFSLCLQMVTRASLLDEECALWAKGHSAARCCHGNKILFEEGTKEDSRNSSLQECSGL